MPQRPWAIDDLIVHDETNLRSVLIGGDGLPAARGWLAQRYGYWPRVSGLARQGYRMTLETYLLHSTPAERLAARTALLQHLNPELEETARLTAVDYVLEGAGRDGVLLAMGPWDVYCDDDGAWHARDILRPDDLEADLSGAWWTGPGEGLNMRADFSNLMRNPSFEVDLAEWVNVSCLTFTRETSGYGVVSGCACAELTTDATNDRIYDLVSADTSAGTEYTFSAYLSGSGSAKIGMWDDVAGWTWSSAIALLETPQLLTMTHTFDGSSVSRIVAIASADGAITCRADAVQLTASPYWVPYRDGTYPGCVWGGTAHDSITTVATGGMATAAIADVGVDFTDGSQGTILTWIKREDWDGQGTDGSAYAFRAYVDASNYIMIFWNVGGNFRLVWDGQGNYDLSGNITSGWTDGEYSSCIITWDFSDGQSDVAFYFNGELMNSESDADPLASNPSNLWIGHSAGLTQWNGDVGTTIILNRPLSAADIADWHGRGTGALNARWVDVLCEGAVPWAPGGVAALNRGLVSTLLVDGNVRWRQRDGDVWFWRIYDDEWDLCLDVDSDDDVWPEYRITPRTAKTKGFTYRQWIPIKWDEDAEAGENYPMLLGTFNLTGKAQADGDDIRVFCNGAEIDRWLAGTLVSSVKVWVNLDFGTCTTMTLVNGIAGAGDVDYIEVFESITDMPSEGILYIGTEAFYYTSKNSRTRRFEGIYRAVRDTSAGAHLASSDVFWIQNDVWIYYGDATLTAPDTDDDYKPMFDLDNSTNISWDYTEFGEDDELRVMQWSWDFAENSNKYTGDQDGGDTDPWEEMGTETNVPGPDVTGYGGWYIYNPCGWATALFENGEFYIFQDLGYNPKHVLLQSCDDFASWATEQTYNLPNTFGAWTPANDITDASINKLWIRLYLRTTRTIGSIPDVTKVEYDDVTLTVENYPVVASAGEVSCYQLACTITNETTDEAMTVEIMLVLDQTLIVDTYNKAVRLDDGTLITTAVTLDDERRDWLRLVPGENVLAFEDEGTVELDIDLLYHRRLFE